MDASLQRSVSTSLGCRLLAIDDPVQRAEIPLALLYPAQGLERTVQLGPYSIDAAMDALPIGEHLPLVVISHGNGGTPWAYRDLAKLLVRSGCVVALPEHRGNSRNDNGLAGTVANLENRPRHVSLTIDAAFVDLLIKDHLAPPRVGVIGHSAGACTALSIAGGQPWAGPREKLKGKPHPVRVVPDARVRSLVLLNPATFWFVPESLKQVRVPILIRTGERDAITPAIHAKTVIDGVFDASQVEHKEIPGAGHFSFMSQFPPQMVRPDFAPSQDPKGFSREDIQPALYAEIVDFLMRTL